MVIGDDGVGLMVVDDGICAFCAKSRVIRAIFSFVLVATVVVTIATPVLSVKDFVAALASYGCVVSAAARSLRVALASRVMAVHLCGEHRVAAAIISSVPPQNNERKENKGVSRECV